MRSLGTAADFAAEVRVTVREFFEREDYASLKRLANNGGGKERLRALWPELEPLQKAALFKLMEPERAIEFYRMLSYTEKYFLLCAFDMGSIAPLLEDVPEKTRALFRKLSDEAYDEMARQLYDLPRQHALKGSR